MARKYDGSGKRGPKAVKANLIRDLVLKMKAENESWGYGHIHGELMKLFPPGPDGKNKISWQTVRRIMIEHGLMDDPKHTKRMNWTTFIKAHFESLAACDFFSVEAWTPKGLVRYLVYFVIDVASRRVHIAGIDQCPDEAWMLQVARNLTDPEHGFLKDKQFMIHDRDPLYTALFRKTLRAAGVRPLKMPKQSPNLNAHSERFVQSIKVECLDKMILFGEKHLRYVVEQYAEHYYNHERPHQGLGNQLIVRPTTAPPARGRIRCRERLGGLLKSYYRQPKCPDAGGRPPAPRGLDPLGDQEVHGHGAADATSRVGRSTRGRVSRAAGPGQGALPPAPCPGPANHPFGATTLKNVRKNPCTTDWWARFSDGRRLKWTTVLFLFHSRYRASLYHEQVRCGWSWLYYNVAGSACCAAWDVSVVDARHKMVNFDLVRTVRTPHSERFLLVSDGVDLAALDVHYLTSGVVDGTFIVLDEKKLPEQSIGDVLERIDERVFPHACFKDGNLHFTVVMGRTLGLFEPHSK